MDSVRIPCPECGKQLRLPDRSLLGKRGRCPKCGHTFVLEEPQPPDDPEEVQLELAESTTPVGASARWVPDATPETPPAPIDPPTTPPQESAPAEGELFNFRPPEDDGISGVARLREIQRRSAKRRKIGLTIGTVLALAVVGVVLVVQSLSSADSESNHPQSPLPIDQTVADTAPQDEQPIATGTWPAPTQGEPISLRYLPAGARIVIHLRPAELWQTGTLGHEVRNCLGPLAQWAESKIREICLFEPADIEELLIGLIPSSRDTPPEIAAVVRLTEDQKKSDLILKFRGERVEEYGHPVFIRHDQNRAYMIYDLKTIAISPGNKAGEMVEARNYPMPTSPGIEGLIQQTDQKHHLTILFDPQDVRIFQNHLVIEDVRPLLNQFLDRLSSDEIEAAAWSLHLGRENFYSRLLLRNQPLISPERLAENVKERLDALPGELYQAVRKMAPEQSGPRRLIGRFPAMVKVLSMATRKAAGVDGSRTAQLATLLPERAAPNLAVAALLAWDESLRTDFNASAPPESAEPQLPDRVVDRLKRNVEIAFNRTPLQDALQFISSEIKVPIDIDGEALKFAGYTKNMPQNLQLGVVPASSGLAAILKQYDKMCIVVDETKQRMTVMTYERAKTLRVEPLALEPPQ